MMSQEAETSLEKGLNILRLLSVAAEGMTVSELSTALNYPPSTVARLLNTLKSTGYIWQGGRRGVYKIGYDILELAGNLLKNMEVRQVARPYLHELAANTHLPAQLKVPSGLDAVLVDVAIPPMTIPLTFEMGRRLLMHISTLGRAILAYRSDPEVQDYMKRVQEVARPSEQIEDGQDFLEKMESIRQRGFEIRDLNGRFHSLAAPILRYDGRPIASVGVGGGFGFDPDLSLSEPELWRIAQHTVTAARRISFSLGYHANQLAG